MNESTGSLQSTPDKPRGTILVVEDSAIQAKILSRLLEKHGYDVTVAVDGIDALERLKGQAFSLVLSDVRMPRMNGIELCKAITGDDTLRAVRVMLVTSLSAPEDIIEGIEAGADNYIVKPYREQHLLDKVREELNGATPPRAHEDPITTKISINGKGHTLTAPPGQFLKLMTSTYENALQQNEELLEKQAELAKLNKKLEANLEALQLSERQQRASEERFRSIVQLIPDIVFRTDLDGNFIFLNNAVRNIGYDPDELLGKHFSIIIDPVDLEKCSRDKVLERYGGKHTGDADAPKLFDERRTGARATRGLEVHLMGKVASKNIEAEVFRITGEVNSSGYYEGGEVSSHELAGTVGAIRDITERKQFEEQLRTLNLSLEEKVSERTRDLVVANQSLESTLEQLRDSQEKIIQSEKLSALGSLVAGVAHEMNNPLMGALNYVQYAERKVEDEKTRLYLGKAERDIQRAAKIVSNMLRFARAPSGDIGQVSVREIVDSTVELMAADYRKNDISLAIDIPEDLPEVRGTFEGLQQVLINLMTNAMHALESESVRKVNLRALRQDRGVRLEVEDSGKGVDLQNLRRIFDPFFTTKPPGKGTGLGLPVSADLVSSFGGSLSCDSDFHEGARFIVDLVE